MRLESVPARPAYIDPQTAQTYPLDEPRWRADSGGPLMITPLLGIGRADIDTARRSLWRYAASFPLPIRNPVTMGEGLTPLIERGWRGGRALFKLEWFAPTGSFKDRGATVMISTLRQQGIDRVLEDSSGNGGAAIAAYAAAGGMRAKILVPAYTQTGKTVQMRAYGADAHLAVLAGAALGCSRSHEGGKGEGQLEEARTASSQRSRSTVVQRPQIVRTANVLLNRPSE